MAVRPIDKECVHKICSGQVVLTLAVAVKELVENSIDAGATSIDIRVKEYGSELVEVTDNGSGIEPENFQALTLKHWTSKIQEFSDVATVGTFGFRGEALSSLCALSDVSVCTRHRDQPVATRLQYNNEGKITSQSKCAREVGTTVTIQNIFHTLPVRHKEFQRNLKKEYGRMVHMLQGYCLVTPLVRFTCHQHAGKGKKQLVLCTGSNSSILDNIANIFGQKQVQQLVKLTQCSGDSISCQEDHSYTPDVFDSFRLSGYVSRCNHGYGRSTSDRQFLFFNGRPCDHQKLSKTVNEVYHMYNRHQYPFVLLNIETTKGSVDVNLTPDKRAVMVQQEKALLILVKESLVSLYNAMQGELDSTSPSIASPPSSQCIGNGATNGRTLAAANGRSESPCNGDSRSLISTLKSNFSFSQSPKHPLPRRSESTVGQKRTIYDMKGYTVMKRSSLEQNSDSNMTEQERVCEQQRMPEQQEVSEQQEGVCEQEEGVFDQQTSLSGTNDVPSLLCPLLVVDDGVMDEEEMMVFDKSHSSVHGRPEVTASFNLRQIASRLGHMTGENSATSGKRRFKARIAPESNQAAEEELRKHLTKDKFHQMEIIGQFNLGFVIAKLDDDLFIIDQHATDEKYNFERLQRDTVIEHQKLLEPISLELTAINEGIVLDNIEVFRKNGFEFTINEDAPPTKRVKLAGQPVSKNWSFGPSDIDELVFLLTDSPGQLVRPSRVSAMFASRACRSSIMIGTPLSSQEMRKLLNHMSETINPWCCPHGRPTLRHLIDLSRLPK